MARDTIIYGETLVSVRGGAHMSGRPIGNLTELGLSKDPITISPIFRHKDMNIDDYGDDIPVEVLMMLAEVRINMTLVHYDDLVLDLCQQEAMGFLSDGTTFAGRLGPAGIPLGKGLPLLASGNQFISLNLESAQITLPHRFPSSYLMSEPLRIPIGTKRTIAEVEWRVIPYRPLAGVTADSTTITITSQSELNQYEDDLSADAFNTAVDEINQSGSTTITLEGSTGATGGAGGEIVSSGAVLWSRSLDS